MNEQEIKNIIDKQRHFFHTAATLPTLNRLNALKN